jgi:methylated-DNA-[protein]-cysteine S-methyltransferase
MDGAVRYAWVPSPIGDLLLVRDEIGLCGVYMTPSEGGGGAGPFPTAGGGPVVPREARLAVAAGRHAPAALAGAADQLAAYFAGELTTFELPLHPVGTDFQLAVWAALRHIPYGQTRSYGDIARAIDRPSAVRAVGLANGRNPISIIVPCHRVIGADGSLTGYGGGLGRKRFLLDLERRGGPDRPGGWSATDPGTDAGTLFAELS